MNLIKLRSTILYPLLHASQPAVCTHIQFMVIAEKTIHLSN